MLKIRSNDNKHSAVWLVEPGVTIGRIASNDLIIDDRRFAERQLEVKVNGDQLTLINRVPEVAVAVNGKPITGEHHLALGDTITLLDRELQVIDPKQEQVNWRGAAATEWSLKANHSALANRVFPLSESTLVGRARECDISLGAAHLSRRHAELRVIKGLLYVKDLDSSNGTFINGRRVTEGRVRRGDELRFDTLSFGVLGPAEELDKTTVRPRGQSAPGGKRSVRAAAPAERSQRPPTVGVRPSQAAVASSGTASSSSPGRSWGVGLVVLLAAGALIGFFLLSG